MRYILMAMILILICLGLSTAQAVTTSDERESLRGLPGVGVIIEDIKPDAQADGLTEEAIRTAVELILRSSGIRVLTQSERMETSSSAYLYVQIITIKDDQGVYSLAERVELIQIVSLARKPQRMVSAATWAMTSVTSVGKYKIRDIISGSIEPRIKEFANDFLAVNPR